MNAAAPFRSQLDLYRDWLAERHGLTFEDFSALRQWSVTDCHAFWKSLWDYHDLSSPTPFDTVLGSEAMPGAEWFPGASTNFAHQVFRHVAAADAAGQAAIVAENEEGAVQSLSWPELERQVASLAMTLRELGVAKGDRVVAYLPNIPAAVVGCLATASLGAIWSLAAPDMGVPAVRDRFRQITPKVLIAADGVYYAGKPLDRSAAVNGLIGELETLEAVILVKTPYASGEVACAMTFEEATARSAADTSVFEPEWVPFSHPLWVVYSSGTTGLPKALVHGHGGIIMATMAGNKHLDIGPSYCENNLNERLHWYSSTGWIMWNAVLTALLGGTTIVLFDGNPSGSRSDPDWGLLWRFAARHKVTFFGAGAAFYMGCEKAAFDLAAVDGLDSIRALGSTGSVLPASTQDWGTAQFAARGTPDIWWCNISGGTDICANFATGNRELPLRAGALQCRQLGSAVEAWDANGRPLVGGVGELVCTRPLPSMPLFLWGDEDGSRYRASYFDTYPGVWRHGDWIEIGKDESVTILGRSDATINRGGLRLGASELYAAVERLPQVADSVAVDLENGGGGSQLILFVVLAKDAVLGDDLLAAIKAAVRASLSPRFVPDAVIAAPDVPRTLSGKKLEVPIKRIMKGEDPATFIDRSALSNAPCIDWYVDYAKGLSSR